MDLTFLVTSFLGLNQTMLHQFAALELVSNADDVALVSAATEAVASVAATGML